VAVDRAQLEGRFTSDREASSLLELSGKNKRGGPKRTWRRTVEEEIGKVGQTWKEVGVLAQNRIRWRCFAEALCP
jgi:hypothetical protein